MKQFIILALALISFNASAQPLLDVYRKGTVKLTPETSYGAGNDWSAIFDSYNDYYEGAFGRKSSAADRMSIIVMPDGSVVVNHPKRDYFSRFDSNGKFLKNFSITGRPSNVKKDNRNIIGVIGNNFYTNADNMGKVICTDFDGKFLKTLKFNYSVYDIISMGDNKLAVLGWVLWKEKSRNFVAIVDYNTNEEKIIWDHFNEDNPIVFKSAVRVDSDEDAKIRKAYIHERMNVPSFGYSHFQTTPFLERPIIQFVNNLLVIALPASGEIRIYDTSGKLQTTQQANWKPATVSIEEQKEVLRNAIESYKNKPLTDKVPEAEAKKAREQVLAELNTQLTKIDKEIKLPTFSNVLKDSDGNLLFFEFPKEKGGNKFNVWVFRDGGKFECQSSFECEGYDLAITPTKMVFYNGYIYALQKANNVQGIPLRLVKFKLSN